MLGDPGTEGVGKAMTVYYCRDIRRPTDRGIVGGDIIVEEGDVYGDGVNVAARLQELASPASPFRPAPPIFTS